jgi:hypothetical protein
MEDRFKNVYRRLRKSLGLRKLSANAFFSRPFKKSDFREIPDGWTVTGPQFVGVGYVRAGTTWWYRMLTEHPQVVQNRLGKKELSYFHHFGFRDLSADEIDTYREAFAVPPGSVCGEWSPRYLTYPYAMELLMKAAPDAKFLVILRNPVDRISSAINQALVVRSQAFGLEKSARYVFSTYSLLPEVVHESFLYQPLKRLLDLVGASRILILQYEKCKKFAASEIARTYRFLGLDDSYTPRNLEVKSNVMPRIFPDFSNTERTNVARYLYDDIRACAELIPDLDLSLWPEFAISK